MATYDTAMILGGMLLPKYGDLKDLIEPNLTNRISLGGTLSTDFKNNRRAWTLSWKLIDESDFQIIYDLYLSQFTNRTYHWLQFDAENIYTPVLIELNVLNLKYNKGFLKDLVIVLREQYAFS